MTLSITRVEMPRSQYSIKCPHPMKPIGLTIHETGNIASAMAEISYMQGNNRQVSYHFAVDDTRAVQGLPLDRNGWHAGDGGQGRGNRRTIGLEHCYNWNGRTTTENDPVNNPKYQKAIANGIELAANLFIQYPEWGEPESGKNIWQHNHHNGKHCPQRIRQEQRWNAFVEAVKDRYNELKNGVSNTYTVKSGDTLWRIANNYGVSVDDLKEWNNLSGDLIRPGQELSVKGKAKPAAPQPVAQPSSTPQPAPRPQVTQLAIDGSWGPATTRRLQQVLGTPADGVISGQYRNAITNNIHSVRFGTGGSLMVREMQRRLSVRVDGYFGPITLRALQRRMGTPVTGAISRTNSAVVKELQRRLNQNRF